VLIVESMAQAAAALVIAGMGPNAGSPLVYFMSIENAKFRKPVTPGDQLRLEMTRDRKRGNVWRFNGVARVNGVTVAEAAVTAMIMDEARTA
jgi:3-hydroxyacyl-[acyl-carrier-protein] dehydratase